MIELKNVSFKYKYKENVLENINLKIEENEIVSIVGVNGAGKSTLLKLISGLAKPTEGTISVDGIDVSEKKNFMEVRKRVGVVFQNPESQVLFPKVRDDIEFALKNLQLDNIDARIQDSLNVVNMSDFINEDVYELSLGQKQRINIASVLAIKPRYILMDEPTTMVDSLEKENIYKIIKNLKKEGYSVVFVTNNINEILLADRILILEDKGIKNIIKKDELIDSVSILKEANIKLPDILDMVMKLKENGIDIKLNEWIMDELIDEIVKVYKR